MEDHDVDHSEIGGRFLQSYACGGGKNLPCVEFFFYDAMFNVEGEPPPVSSFLPNAFEEITNWSVKIEDPEVD